MEPAQLAVITGASLGLGAVLAEGLATSGWSLVIDGRDPVALDAQTQRLRALHAGAGLEATVRAVAGDVADPHHRAALGQAAAAAGRVDVVVLNASILGPSPQPSLVDYPLDELRAIYEVNTIAPLAVQAPSGTTWPDPAQP